MNERYGIRVQGFLVPVLRAAFAGLHCESLARDSTIRGRLSQDELNAILVRLDGYGLELVQVSCKYDD